MHVRLVSVNTGCHNLQRSVAFRFRYVHQIGILSIVVIDVQDHREAKREG
jgi:hypothetical protein